MSWVDVISTTVYLPVVTTRSLPAISYGRLLLVLPLPLVLGLRRIIRMVSVQFCSILLGGRNLWLSNNKEIFQK